MTGFFRIAPILAPLVLIAAPAQGAELFGGALVHGVNTPFTVDTHESGIDFELGVRSDRIEALRFIGSPHAHAFVSINSARDTDFAAAGLDWTIGKGPLYLRPGIGIAVHDGPSYRIRNGYRTDLGSRVLFEPEISAGVRLDPRWSAEASWVHISHAQLFSPQNPGLDTIGLRLNYRLR